MANNGDPLYYIFNYASQKANITYLIIQARKPNITYLIMQARKPILIMQAPWKVYTNVGR